MKIIRLAAVLFVVLASAMSASAMSASAMQLGVFQLDKDVQKSIIKSLDDRKIPPIPKELETQWSDAKIPKQQQQYNWGLVLGLGKMYLDWRYDPIPELRKKIAELEARIKALEDAPKQK